MGVLDDDALTARVVQIIARTTRIDVERISAAAQLTDLGLNSLDALNIAFALEDEFKITIPDEVAGAIDSVPSIVEQLRPLLRARAQQVP